MGFLLFYFLFGWEFFPLLHEVNYNLKIYFIVGDWRVWCRIWDVLLKRGEVLAIGGRESPFGVSYCKGREVYARNFAFVLEQAETAYQIGILKENERDFGLNSVDFDFGELMARTFVSSCVTEMEEDMDLERVVRAVRGAEILGLCLGENLPLMFRKLREQVKPLVAYQNVKWPSSLEGNAEEGIKGIAKGQGSLDLTVVAERYNDLEAAVSKVGGGWVDMRTPTLLFSDEGGRRWGKKLTAIYDLIRDGALQVRHYRQRYLDNPSMTMSKMGISKDGEWGEVLAKLGIDCGNYEHVFNSLEVMASEVGLPAEFYAVMAVDVETIGSVTSLYGGSLQRRAGRYRRIAGIEE